jgi:hypothetical protein
LDTSSICVRDLAEWQSFIKSETLIQIQTLFFWQVYINDDDGDCDVTGIPAADAKKKSKEQSSQQQYIHFG